MWYIIKSERPENRYFPITAAIVSAVMWPMIGGAFVVVLPFIGIYNWMEKIQERKKNKECQHKHTHEEDCPDGSGIEICDDCGKSRNIWEQGQSSWIMIDDIPKAREGMIKVMKKVEE
jgi:hypothetical protein